MKNKILGFWAAWATTAAALLVLCLFAGCAGCQATTVPVTYTEPARVNLSGVKRIAIDSNSSEVADSVSRRLTATGKYTVATAAELAAWKSWSEERRAMEQWDRYQKSATEISAAELVSAYGANVVSADASYKGKSLRITGVVNEIEQSSKGNYFVRLASASNDSVVVYFAPSERSKMEATGKGQTITIIGECFGRNLPDMEDTAEILRILGAGRTVNIMKATFLVEVVLKDYPGQVDAVIFVNTSSSDNFSTSTRTKKEAAKDSDGNYIKDAQGKVVYREWEVTVYERSATVNIAYRIERIVRTGGTSPIGQGTKSATSKKSSSEDQSSLPTYTALVAKTIEEPLAEFISDIVPTQRSINVTLAKESENKDAKKEMSATEKLVKAKNYRDAAAEYGKIYAKYKNFAAGYNQAVLTETTAGTAAAITLMEALVKATGNSTAQATLAEMQARNASNQRAAAQLSQ